MTEIKAFHYIFDRNTKPHGTQGCAPLQETDMRHKQFRRQIFYKKLRKKAPANNYLNNFVGKQTLQEPFQHPVVALTDYNTITNYKYYA